MHILHFFLIIVGTLIDAIIDHFLIKQKKNVHNAIQYIARGAYFAMLSLVFGWVHKRWDQHYVYYSFFLSFMIYWWLFDTSLNIMRKKPLWYLSDHGIDAIQRPVQVVFFFKLVFAVLASLYFFYPWLYEISG
jgi:hypothetical protein